MVQDGQKVRTEWTDGCTDIPLTSSADNKQMKSNGNIDFKKNHSTVQIKISMPSIIAYNKMFII